MKTRFRLLILGLSSSFLAFAGTLQLFPSAIANPASFNADSVPASVDDLAWMSGRWIREDKGQFLEETWTEPEGDALVGMFRWARQGKFWLYELMSIEEENGSLVFRLRHFNRGLEPWASEASGPLTYPLASLEENKVVFENPERDSPRRFVYERNDEQLTIKMQGESEAGGDVFRFDLVP